MEEDRCCTVQRRLSALCYITVERKTGGLFPTKLFRIEVWSKITSQLAMKTSLSLRTMVTERKTKERRDQRQSKRASGETAWSNIWFLTGSRETEGEREKI